MMFYIALLYVLAFVAGMITGWCIGNHVRTKKRTDNKSEEVSHV